MSTGTITHLRHDDGVIIGDDGHDYMFSAENLDASIAFGNLYVGQRVVFQAGGTSMVRRARGISEAARPTARGVRVQRGSRNATAVPVGGRR